MLPSSYIYYKNQKLLHPEFQSEFETKAVYVLNKLGCTTDFHILLLKKENAEMAKVEISTLKNKRVIKISVLNTYPINDMPTCPEPAFAFSATPPADALQDAILQKMPAATFHTSQVPFNGNTTKGIIMVNHGMIGKYTIATSVGEFSLLDFLFKKETDLIRITIPLDDNTLTAPFCGNICWGDALPTKDAYDSERCGVKCIGITVRTVVDAYQNIFLFIRDSLGNGKVLCLHDAFDNADTPTVTPAKTKPKQKNKPALKEPLPENTFFIIDTNAFIYEPDLVTHLKDGIFVYLSYKVMEELDGLKCKDDTKNAASLALKCLNESYDRIKIAEPGIYLLPKDFNLSKADNRIISCALKLQKDSVPVTLVTNDNGMALKAKGLNVPVLCLNEFKKKTYTSNKKNNKL